jgi:hypothetical protein
MGERPEGSPSESSLIGIATLSIAHSHEIVPFRTKVLLGFGTPYLRNQPSVARATRQTIDFRMESYARRNH